jgi:LmbE family N-acetylglucosaminyl deacetylase
VKGVHLIQPGERVTLLCIGAHADDIEIGAGGSIMTWLSSGALLSVHWCVASAAGQREAEAKASMSALLADAQEATFHFGNFRDSYLPYQGQAVKDWVAELRDVEPDLILTHQSQDAHQDHRLISELTWSVFRDHMILEYEIPKWDGDMGQPNLYVPLTRQTLDRKIGLLDEQFGSQRGKDWFDDETFQAIARLRGMECRAPERYAEAFWFRKAVAV